MARMKRDTSTGTKRRRESKPLPKEHAADNAAAIPDDSDKATADEVGTNMSKQLKRNGKAKNSKTEAGEDTQAGTELGPPDSKEQDDTYDDDVILIEVKKENGNYNNKDDSLFQRASSLTKISGLEPGSHSARRLLLKETEATETEKTRKRKTSTRKKKVPDKPDMTTSSRTKTAEEGLIPFWMTLPKNIDDISMYTKTLCTRLSHIEKQIKNYETERQGLLNALYQVNRTQFPDKEEITPFVNPDSQNNTKTPIDNCNTVDLTNETLNPDAEASKDQENSQKAAKTTNIASVEPLISQKAKADTQLGVSVERQYATLEKSQETSPYKAEAHEFEANKEPKVAKGQEYGAPLEKPNTCEEVIEILDVDDDYREDIDAITPQRDLHLLNAQTRTGNDDLADETPIEECSQRLRLNITRLSSMMDSELEFRGGRQLEDTAVDYNSGMFEDSRSKNDFKMWRSCWLKAPEEESPMLFNINSKRSSGASRSSKNGQEASTAGEREEIIVPENPTRDLLDCFWNMDFNALSKHKLTMLAQFFGMKGSLNGKAQIEEMERIRNYLSDFRVK